MSIFCSLIHAPRMFFTVSPAVAMPLWMASSKLLSEVEKISMTLATDMAFLLALWDPAGLAAGSVPRPRVAGRGRLARQRVEWAHARGDGSKDSARRCEWRFRPRVLGEPVARRADRG